MRYEVVGDLQATAPPQNTLGRPPLVLSDEAISGETMRKWEHYSESIYHNSPS